MISPCPNNIFDAVEAEFRAKLILHTAFICNEWFVPICRSAAAILHGAAAMSDLVQT